MTTLDSLTPSDLDALERLERAATKGPWTHYRDKLRPKFPTRINEVQCTTEKTSIVKWPGFDDSDRPEKQHAANAALIAVARNALPALIAMARENARLKVRVEAAEKVVEAAHTRDQEADFHMSACMSQIITNELCDCGFDALHDALRQYDALADAKGKEKQG